MSAANTARGRGVSVIAVDRTPGSSAVLLGIVQLAVHDTAVAIHGGYRPYAARLTVTRPASTAAAVATAAQRVLVARVPGQAGTVNDRYAESLSPSPTDRPRPTASASAPGWPR